MSRNLKILHIISSWESGMLNELAEFAVRLPRDEFENELCVLSGSKRRNIPDIPTTTLGMRWTFDVAAHLNLRYLLRRFRPDIIHTWDSTAQFYGAIHCGSSRLFAEKREYVPKSVLQRYIDGKTSRFIVPRQNDLHDHCAKTNVITLAAVPMPFVDPIPAEKLLTTLGFPLVEPAGDYYPVFQSQYEPARRNYVPSAVRQTPFFIGIVLPLCSEHRILDALWIFETFNHVHLNYHAFVIGDGKDRELYLRCRDQWNLFSRVHFLGNQPESYRLLPSVDVLLHLSSSAEYSGTILSAMSCGVPVIALETPESRDYILDGTTGFLIPSEGDFRYYRRTATKRLLYLLENMELRQSMRTAAKERVAAQFNFDTAMQQRMKVYREE